MKYALIVTAIIVIFSYGCRKPGSNGRYQAVVICKGGCLPNAFYATITSNNLSGRTAQVYDASGNVRGNFTNVVIINNLNSSDMTEGKQVGFSSYTEPLASCQSSFPRIHLEIEIVY